MLSEIKHLAASEFPMSANSNLTSDVPMSGPTPAQSSSERNSGVDANENRLDNFRRRSTTMLKEAFSNLMSGSPTATNTNRK